MVYLPSFSHEVNDEGGGKSNFELRNQCIGKSGTLLRTNFKKRHISSNNILSLSLVSMQMNSNIKFVVGNVEYRQVTLD